MGSKKNRLAAKFLLLCAVLGLLVACASEERAPAEDGDDRAVTRTVTVAEAAPPEKTTTVTAEASAEPSSSCGTTPQRVLELQYRHINEGEYESAYAFFADRSKALITPAQYRAFFEENAPYSVTDYSFPSVDVAGGMATVGIEFTATSGGVPERLSRTQELVCEMGSWRVVMREEQVAAFAGTGQEEGAAEEIVVTGVIEDAPDRADGTPAYGITDESTMTGTAPPIGYILEGDYSAYVGQRVTVYGTPSHLGEFRVLNVTRIEQ